MMKTSFAIIVAFASACLLASCQADPAQHALATRNFLRLMNQPVQQAIDILGPADKITVKNSGTVYRWNALKNEAPLTPDYSPDAENLQCSISVLVRADGTIAKGRIVGNVKSCHKYDDAINDHFPEYPSGKLINRSYLRRADEGNIN